MKIEDIHELLSDCDDASDLAWEGWEGGALFTLAKQGEEEVDRKWCFTSTVMQEIATGDYYEITTSRSNSGYWGDGENGDTEIRQVVPSKKIVEITEWKGI